MTLRAITDLMKLSKRVGTLIGVFVGVSAAAAPIELVPGGLGSGRIFTSCTFDGHDQRCLFDSGSDSSNIVDSDIFASYPSLAKSVRSGASGRPQNCDWVLIQSLIAVGLMLPQHQVVRCPEPVPGNVIGIDVFQGKTLHIDFKSLSLEGTDALIPIALSRNHFFFAPAGQLLVPIVVGDGTQQAVWDTGAGLSAVDQQFAKAHPEMFMFVQNISGGTDSTGNPVNLALYTMKSMIVGGRTFNNVSVLGFDFSASRDGIGDSANLILGYNVITQSNWYFDLRTRSWSID